MSAQKSAQSTQEVLICVCGGIAAYKVCEVVSTLAKSDIAVTVAMTRAATKFVGPLTFEALSGRRVFTDLWAPDSDVHDPQHIRLARNAGLICVAPATANIIAKMAAGISDDLVSSLLLAAVPKNILLAPAMNEGMWEHPATVRNVATLTDWGMQMIGPENGWQACRTTGAGRLSEPTAIVERIRAVLSARAPTAALGPA